MNLPTKILALDFETTGLSSSYDTITQIGAVIYEDGEPVTEFYSSVRPTSLAKLKISVEALSVQLDGVDDKECGGAVVGKWWDAMLKAELTADVAKKFSAWLSEHGAASIPIVAHNAAFDLAFLEAWLFAQRSSCNRAALSPVAICTKALAGQVLLGLPKYGLDAMCEQFGIGAREGAHGALDDAHRCAKVYFHLLSEAGK